VTKEDKAEKVIGFLGGWKSEWIQADCSPRGQIAYIVQGMKEKIYTYSDRNITDSYRDVASAVIGAGFNYGRCEEIVKKEKDEIEDQRKDSEALSKGLSNIMKDTEKRRISKLSETEKLFEIYEKYRIKVLKHEILKD